MAAGKVAVETDEADPNAAGGVRATSEKALLAVAAAGVCAMTVRLPPCAHDESRQGLATMLAGAARKKGFFVSSDMSADVHSTWINDDRTFVSVVGRVTTMALDYGAANALGHSARGHTNLVAGDMTVAAGTTVNVAPGLWLAPDATVAFGTLAIKGFADSNGVSIRANRLMTGSGTAGLTVGHDFGRAASGGGTLYARVALVQPFGNNMELVASKDGGVIAPDTISQNRRNVEYLAGTRFRAGRKLNLMIEGGRTTGLNLASGYNGRVGLQLGW